MQNAAMEKHRHCYSILKLAGDEEAQGQARGAKEGAATHPRGVMVTRAQASARVQAGGDKPQLMVNKGSACGIGAHPGHKVSITSCPERPLALPEGHGPSRHHDQDGLTALHLPPAVDVCQDSILAGAPCQYNH